MGFKNPQKRKEYDANRRELRLARQRDKRQKAPLATISWKDEWKDERFQELDRLIALEGKEQDGESEEPDS